MNFQTFLKELTEEIRVPYAEGGVLKVQTVHKSETLKIKAVALYQEGKRLTPWIYMAPFYRLCREGVSFKTIRTELESILGMCVLARNLPDDLFLNFSSALPYMKLRMIPEEGNRNLLPYVPHRSFCDLAVLYHLLIPCGENHIGSAIIYSDHLLLWGVTEDILFQAVQEEQEAEKDFRIERLSYLLRECFSSSYPETGLFFLSNKAGYYGASVILNPTAIRSAGEVVGKNGYLLPASVHEVLLVAKDRSPSPDTLRSIIWEVNHTELLPEEVLTDNLFVYDGEKGTVSLAEEESESAGKE